MPDCVATHTYSCPSLHIVLCCCLHVFLRAFFSMGTLIVCVSVSLSPCADTRQRAHCDDQAVMIVLEALSEQEGRIDASIQGHSGDHSDITLVDWDQLPQNRAERLAILQAMVTHSAYCWSGDHTLEGIRSAVHAVSERAASVGDSNEGDRYACNVKPNPRFETTHALADLITCLRLKTQRFCGRYNRAHI